jgi:two-component system, NtrC family, sensor kinase
MLEKAMRLCEAAFGSFYTHDGERIRSIARRGVPAAYAHFRTMNDPAGRWSVSPGARIIETKRPVHILDMKAEEFYLKGGPNERAVADLGGARTVLYCHC